MTIENTDQGWSAVELKAQTAELGQIDTPKVPEPTAAQNLAWSITRCAELAARLHRKDSAIAQAIMWLSLNEAGRAREELNRGLLGL